MKSTVIRGIVMTGASALAIATYSPLAGAQSASPGVVTYQANLTQQNKSNASGTATVAVNGTNVTVTIRGNGFSPNVAHAAHIHIGGKVACPTTAADTNKDGFVDAKEGEPFVGPIKVTLSTSGDTSANSALATDRAPKADAKGVISYNRTFALPSGVAAADLSKGSIEIHGIASLSGDKAKYDGDKKSELDSKLPFETTAPAVCGQLTTAPTGGAATGVGAVNGIESPALLATGSLALVGCAIAVIVARKQLTTSRQG